jgi:hypothetical protein
MKSLFGWTWQKLYIPPAVSKQKNAVVKIFDVSLAEPEKFPDLNALRRSDTVFISGDGHCLAQDVAEFNSWRIPHDIYAVNRSLIFHQRQVQHWAAVDVEEATWFTEFVNEKVEPDHLIIRHSIGGENKEGKFVGTGLYDCYWNMDYDWENEYQRRVFVGNTGYFAVLSSIKMGYKHIILGGMPLDVKPHFYETPDQPGPLWTGMTYMQWMDFKMIRPEAERVRSLSGYSAFILGKATKEWAQNGSDDRISN